MYDNVFFTLLTYLIFLHSMHTYMQIRTYAHTYIHYPSCWVTRPIDVAHSLHQH